MSYVPFKIGKTVIFPVSARVETQLWKQKHLLDWKNLHGKTPPYTLACFQSLSKCPSTFMTFPSSGIEQSSQTS